MVFDAPDAFVALESGLKSEYWLTFACSQAIEGRPFCATAAEIPKEECLAIVAIPRSIMPSP